MTEQKKDPRKYEHSRTMLEATRRILEGIDEKVRKVYEQIKKADPEAAGALNDYISKDSERLDHIYRAEVRLTRKT